jgi:hypothetical protein
MSGDDEDGEFLTLIANRASAEASDPDTRRDEAVAIGYAYATAKGQRLADALEFRRKDKTAFTMPYGYRPIIWWHPPETILIEYPGFFTVALTGKDLQELYHRVSDQRVTWIRECDPAQAANLPVAVTRMEILRAYPSRDASGTAW